jgi:hypothetical protein
MRHWKNYALRISIAVLALSLRAQNLPSGQTSVGSVETAPAGNAAGLSYVTTKRSDSEADASSNVTNESNNPITPKRQIILQNFFMPSPHGDDGRPADLELLRFYLPVKVFGIENILRLYQPIETAPLLPDGRDGGLGDTTLYDLALHRISRFTLGGGPLLVFPIASHKNLGDGKWQAGAAGIVVTERSWGLVGTVVTYQHSFSGYGSNRPTAELLTVQPLIHYNFHEGYYLRSSGLWNIDRDSHVNSIPIGFGPGKVWKLPGDSVMNLYAEPQYSVYRTGTGAPNWQILSGLSFQFPNRNSQIIR